MWRTPVADLGSTKNISSLADNFDKLCCMLCMSIEFDWFYNGTFAIKPIILIYSSILSRRLEISFNFSRVAGEETVTRTSVRFGTFSLNSSVYFVCFRISQLFY